MAGVSFKETDLYGPIKQMLEGQGYVVKSEIGAADVVAVRGAEEPVIVELKTGFSLSLFHQAIARQAITDAVYVAVALRFGSTLITLDRQQRDRARQVLTARLPAEELAKTAGEQE